MRIILIFLTVLSEIFSLKRWVACWLFSGNFYFTPEILLARVIEAINADKGMPYLLTKLMHNKLTYFGWGSSQTLLEYWDLRFLREFNGIIGGFGVYLALWYLLTNDRRNAKIWIVVISIILLSFVELFVQPDLDFIWKIILFGMLFLILSVYGIANFLKTKERNRYLIIGILLSISFLTIFFLPDSFLQYCLRK